MSNFAKWTIVYRSFFVKFVKKMSKNGLFFSFLLLFWVETRTFVLIIAQNSCYENMKWLTPIYFILLAGLCFEVNARDLMRYERFTKNDGLPANRITSICEDSNGDIWMSTWNGLCRWDGKQMTAFIASRDGKKFERIYGLQVLSDGRLFYTNDAKDSLCFDPKNKKVTKFDDPSLFMPHESNLSKVDIIEDEIGITVVRQGVKYRLPYNEGVRQEKQLHAYYEDSKGDIWMEFKNILYHLWFEPSPFFYYYNWPGGGQYPFQATVRSLYSTSDGKMLAASRNYRIYGLSDTVVHVPYPGNVYNIQEDDQHRYWFALRKKGLYLWDEDKCIKPAMDNLKELGMDDAFTLLKIRNQPLLWVGTWGKGIRLLDISKEKPEVIATLYNDTLKSIHTLSLTQNGLVCACTSNGLHFFSPTGVPVMVVAPQWNILCGVELPDQRFLFGTLTHGLYWMNANGSVSEAEEFSNTDRMHSMYLTKDSSLWLVSDARLYRYSLTTNKLDVLDAEDFGEDITFSEATFAQYQDSLLCIGASSGFLEVNLNQVGPYLNERRQRGEQAHMEKILLYTFISMGLVVVLLLIVWIIWQSVSRHLKAKQEVLQAQTLQSQLENAADSSIESLSMADAAREREEFMNKLNAVMEEAIGNPDVDIALLSKMMGMPKNAFYFRCNEMLHTSPAALLQDRRIDRAQELLERGDASVRDVAFLVGFRDPKYFSKVFKAKMGVSPSQIKREESQPYSEAGAEDI